KLIEREALDAAIVAVPTCHHARVALDLIDAGIPVLVEKPVATTTAEAREMVDRAARRGSMLAIGHIERFNPAVVELRRQIKAGALGRIFQVKARRTGPFAARIRDAGVVIDLAIHDLD